MSTRRRPLRVRVRRWLCAKRGHALPLRTSIFDAGIVRHVDRCSRCGKILKVARLEGSYPVPRAG